MRNEGYTVSLWGMGAHDYSLEWERAMQVRPGFESPLWWLTHRKLENYDLALADYSKAIELDPNKPVYYNNRGNTHNKLENYDLALADYSKAIELDPNFDLPVYNKACTYALLKDTGEACTWLRRACQMSDKYGDMAKEDADFDDIREEPCFMDIIEEFTNSNSN